MPSQKNREEMERIKALLSDSSIIIGTGFTGLNVSTQTALRRHLRQQGLQYKVIKNTLAKIAAQELNMPGVQELLQGPTGLLLGRGDPVEPAKVLSDYLRASRTPLAVYGAIVGEQLLNPAEVLALASLPPLPILISQLLGQLSGQMAGLVRTLNNPAQRLAFALAEPSRSLVTVLQRHVEATQAGATT